MLTEEMTKYLLNSQDDKFCIYLSLFVKAWQNDKKHEKAQICLTKLSKCGIFSVRGEEMKCIYCGHSESKVLDSRNSDETNSIRRRRECLNCGRRFTTYESVERVPVVVIKKDGSKQPFDREKLKRGIVKACEKRNIKMETIEEVLDNIEKRLQSMTTQEVASTRLAELALSALKALDEIAYVRYALVYKNFDNTFELKTFLSTL